MSDDKLILVFTDLDGTFLDHQDYSYEAAMPAVERLKSIGAHIIPTTSKTLGELDALELPFENEIEIAENGMVISDDENYEVPGKSYVHILSFLHSLPEHLKSNIESFHSMSVMEVRVHTGLSEQDADLAKIRFGSEPFLWTGDRAQMEELTALAAEEEMTITQGGRFYHIMGTGGKDTAAEKVVGYFREVYPTQELITIGLGDGPNDASMLTFVDYAIKIPNPHGKFFVIDKPEDRYIEAPAPGPEGWNLAINKLLDDLRL